MIDHNSAIIYLQQIASNAWPSKNFVIQNGWIVRITKGIHYRANSVLTINYTGKQTAEDIKHVEHIYSKFNLNPVFQIADYCAPNNLDLILENLGYSKHSVTYVMVIESIEIDLTIINNSDTPDDQSASLSTDLNQWYSKVCEFGRYSKEKTQEKRMIIENISQEKFFFHSQLHDEIVAVCMVVNENRHSGIFEVAVDPQYRRRRIGLNLMKFVLAHALKNNISTTYLQVEAANKPAVSLYKQLGFKILFKYHYREKINKK